MCASEILANRDSKQANHDYMVVTLSQLGGFGDKEYYSNYDYVQQFKCGTFG